MIRKIILSASILTLAILISGAIIVIRSSTAKAYTATDDDHIGGCRTECIYGYEETTWDDGYYVHPSSYCKAYCPDQAE